MIQPNTNPKMQILILLLLGLSFVMSEKLETCPLNFEFLEKLINGSSASLKFNDLPTECTYMLKGLRLVRSEYLRSTGRFSPPETSSEACWTDFQALVNINLPEFNLRSSCGFKTDLLLGTRRCMNVTTRSDFEHLVSGIDLDDLSRFCSHSLRDDSSCKACNERLVRIGSSYFEGSDGSDCSGYPFIYAAAIANTLGPTDLKTARCLFSLDLSNSNKKAKKDLIVFWGIFTGCTNGIFGTLIVLWFVWLWHLKNRTKKKISSLPEEIEAGPVSEADMIKGRASSLIRFTMEEVRVATDNFSREKIIGKGGFGNVYRGILEDGSEVALKRFKSWGVAEDVMFRHEVEVIASVSHVNLVALRGYCTATLPWEGHQRIIVCDIMRNGSLFDHMFGSARQEEVPLSWPVRQRISLGTARGLAYLHYGLQPAIIHRDVKASNILLDEDFEPRLADFGLAKFTPNGQSHVSTKVAGTLGYVAPEYALYGQLTERSDVYSFGVVLLEILSSKKAVTMTPDGETLLLADWAWSLVRRNKALDVVDPRIPELGGPELLEKYVLVALLCSHPLLYARPTMDHVVKLLETDSPVPLIPDRPTMFMSASDDGIHNSSSSISDGSYRGFSTDYSTSYPS